MGIGVSLAMIALGAILAFALRIDLSGVDIQMVGMILILIGLISMAFTLKYTRPRRRASVMSGVDPGYVDEPPQGETVVHEERVIERPVAGGGTERVERIVEHPVQPGEDLHTSSTSHSAQDPAEAQNPAYAQDPARSNRSGARPRAPHERRI
ncbi:DUF6458 family protein [Spirillospora sp. CA-294931]|uniref:DUF6458 family protein n=1 Tax=Spirillospora sp. CA-294931 TaxID=3240042 RepID=UPI003D8F9416